MPIDVFNGITDEDAAKVVDGLAPKVADRNDAIEQVKKLYKLFCESDCTLLEVSMNFYISLVLLICMSFIGWGASGIGNPFGWWISLYCIIIIIISLVDVLVWIFFFFFLGQINPLAETSGKQLVAADAKLNFDDNAAFRQKEIFALRDPTQEDPREVWIVIQFS